MYTYKDSGRDGYDILVVTKQGHEKSGLPCGVVIPIGDCYVPHGMFSFEHILDFEEKHGLTESMAMHSPGNQNQVLSIRSGSHYMNRFGLFLSAADPFADSGGRLRYSGRVIAAENHCFFGRDASLSVSTKKERRNNMSRKRKSAIPTNAADQKTRLYVGTIHTRDLRPATPARFLPISGFGVHGDTKYNRRRQKRADRMEIAAWKEKEE